jgi:nucleoside-diphosphate-sugar epimerase
LTSVRTIRSVAVTGATGFIGHHLTAALVARGIEVRAIVRPESTHPVPRGAAEVRAPLDTPSLCTAFAGVDAIVHLAGIISAIHEAAYAIVNVEGTRAVATAAAMAGARLVHVSSLAAAGPASAKAPRSEADRSQPCTPYGQSKLEGETVVVATPGLRWTILRPGVVYGPGDRALWPLFKAATRGVLPLVGRADAAYTFIHVSDVVRALVAAIESVGEGDVMFLGHARPVTPREILEEVRRAVGRPAFIVPVPLGVTRAAATACDLVGRLLRRPLPLNRDRYIELAAEGFVCRVDRLRDQLGIVAEIDLREGIERTTEWYRRQGWLGARSG